VLPWAVAVLRLLAALAGIAVVGLAVLWVGQRKLLYFPHRYDLGEVTAAAARVGLEPWAPGGEFLGWRAPDAAARGTLVVLHGNAGSALDRLHYVAVFRRAAPETPLEVLLVEYPGYGPRPGTPTEASLVAAARTALREARRLRAGPVFLAGESLGSAVAALAAAEAPAEVDGLILVTPLASVPAVAARHYPFLPGILARDTLRADRALPRYGGPVAFLVAGRDEVVFTDLGLALHGAYPGRKGLWMDERAGHNTLDWRAGLPRWREMVEFLCARP